MDMKWSNYGQQDFNYSVKGSTSGIERSVVAGTAQYIIYCV